ncbi:MAG: DnaJ domain-containing protein [Planctomycetota bacterium]
MSDQTQHPAEPGGYAARNEVRMATQGLCCHAGNVLDMSGGGMRVVVPWKSAPRVGDPETYVFGEGPEEIRLMGTVRWVRPAGRLHKRAEVGVEFVGLTDQKRTALRRFAATGDVSPVVAEQGAEAGQDRVRVEFPDLYKIFHLSVYASQEDIRRAYHKLAKAIHPDRCDDPEAEAKFAEVQKAYSILRDRELRAKYDERLANEQRRAA